MSDVLRKSNFSNMSNRVSPMPEEKEFDAKYELLKALDNMSDEQLEFYKGTKIYKESIEKKLIKSFEKI